MSYFYGDILSINDNKIKNLRKKKDDIYLKETISKKCLSDYEENGYELYQELKTRYRVRKKKPVDVYFEDKIWVLLSKMGFDEINIDRNFKISISSKTSANPKQVDVFVKDDNTAIVVECKSSYEKKSKSLRKDINEINGIMEPLINNIRKYYGGNKLKIGFILATYNIELNKSDKEILNNANIFHLNEDIIKYYNELVKQIGHATKYFFLAEIFANKKIPNLDITVPAIEGRLGNNTFYSFAIEPSKLLPIAYVSHRLNIDSDNEEISYQRMLKKNRLNSIKNYIENENGIIPNSIIINFHKSKGKSMLNFYPSKNEHSSSTTKIGFLKLPNVFRSAWIIDGQHRLYSFIDSKYQDILSIPVIAFDGLDSVEQARLFKDINSKQVKVPRNLLDDLYSDLFWDSDYEEDKMYSLISRIVIELGKDNSSPFYGKIASSTESTTNEKPLTIATLTDMIRNSKLLGKVEKSSNTLIPGPLYSVIHDKMINSKNRAKTIISMYYDIIRYDINNNWNLGKADGGYLCTNNGVVALFLLFEELIKYIQKKSSDYLIDVKEDKIIDDIKPLLIPLIKYFNSASYDTFMRFRRQLGKGGQRNCSFEMMKIINSTFSDFNPTGLEQFIKEKDPKFYSEAHDIIRSLQIMMSENILSILQKYHSNEGRDWWYESIPEKIRVAAAAISETDQDHPPREQCLTLINYKSIIAHNWKLFSEIYGFNDLGNSKEKQLSWFNSLNTVRNKVSHPEKGYVTEEELELVKHYHEIIKERIDNLS